jgi:hypothetical protein
MNDQYPKSKFGIGHLGFILHLTIDIWNSAEHLLDGFTVSMLSYHV